MLEKRDNYHILLGVKLSDTKGFPVGKVNFMDVHPLTFSEFLNAVGQEKLCQWMEEISKPEPLPEPLHNELLEWLRKYFFIGGMSEAVALYIKEQNLSAVRQVQTEILNAYELDFAKHAPPTQIMKITLIWQSILSQLAKKNKKFIFSAVSKSARGREYAAAIQWLADAGLIYKSLNILTPKLPLERYSDNAIFKVFFIDVGLLAAQGRVPAQAIINGDQLFSEFNGAFTENFVAQSFVAREQPFYYWTSEGIAEIDFVIADQLQIFPLEVKARFSSKKRSLLVYDKKYQPTTLTRANLMNLRRDGKICNYPLYLINRFPDLNLEK